MFYIKIYNVYNLISFMIYICNPGNIIYGLSIFLYISIFELMVNPQLNSCILFVTIIFNIYIIINYWKTSFNINYKILLISCGLAIFNGSKYYINNGWTITDEINYKNNSLQKYYFIKIDSYNNHNQWTIKKSHGNLKVIDNYYIKISSISLYKKYLIEKISIYLKNQFPQNYGFIEAVLLNKKENFNGQIFYNLGLGHYIAFSGFHVQILFYSIYYFIMIFLWPWSILSHMLSTILGLLIIIFLTWINGSPSSIRSCLMLIILLWTKWFHWPYNPWFSWWITFIIIHTIWPLLIYHPSFLMSFFIVWIFFINQKNFWFFSSFQYKIFQEILINSVVFLFSSHFFTFFTLFYIIFNIICKDFFLIMILITLFGLIIPYLSFFIDNFLNIFISSLSFLESFNYKINFFENISFHYLIGTLFFLYCIFCIKFMRLIDLIVYLIIFMMAYNVFLFCINGII